MEFRNGSNTISDARFEGALRRMYDRHAAEYETVHNGSGRSEELPSQLSARQSREVRALENARKTLSVAQWVKAYPDQQAATSIREASPAASRIDAFWAREIRAGKGLQEQQQPRIEQRVQKAQQQQ